MSPDMRFFAPETVAEACRLLAQGAGYQCLAGGGLVVPAMRGGRKPAGLISLKQVAGLRGLSKQKGAVRIGAMTTHAAVIQSDLLAGGLALVRRAAGQIAHPVIRNMATVGGTLCRADPSADYCCALLAAGALVHLRSPDAERAQSIEDFILGNGQTTRFANELLVAVSLPGDPGRGSSGYIRFSRVDGDYPIATAAVRLAWTRGSVSGARIAIGGCGPTAFRAVEAESLLIGVKRLADVPSAVAEIAVALAQPADDIKASADYRRLLIPGILRGALAQAFS